MHLREAADLTPPVPHDPEEAGSLFCPRFQYAVELLGRRWLGAIVRVLVGGPARFNEILAAVPGLSDRLLTERLREMESLGLVDRRVEPTRPVRVSYALTECGRSLEEVCAGIGTWAVRWVRLPDDGPR